MAVASAGTLFDEVIDFLASAPTVEQIIAFQPSDALKQRSHELLERNRNDLLTAEERTELDDLLRMNHFVNMLKIRAAKVKSCDLASVLESC